MRARFSSSTPTANIMRAIGSLQGGEGYFKRPTGIAVDSAAQRIYVTDTLRNQVFVLDMQGSVLQTIGKTGAGGRPIQLPDRVAPGWGRSCIVVDAMNFRVQVFDRSGTFQLRHWQDGRQRWRDVPAKGGRRRFRRRPLRGRCFVGGGAGFQPPGRIAVLLRRRKERTPASSSCRRDCSSIMTTEFCRGFIQSSRPGVSLLSGLPRQAEESETK